MAKRRCVLSGREYEAEGKEKRTCFWIKKTIKDFFFFL